MKVEVGDIFKWFYAIWLVLIGNLVLAWITKLLWNAI